jgi:hypothetical protein
VEVGSSTIKIGHKRESADEEAEITRVFAVVHILGYSFISSGRDAFNPDFGFKCKATIPVASKNFVALDNSELCVEVFADNWVWPDDEEEDGWQERTLVYVGTERLETVFGTSSICEKIANSQPKDWPVEHSLKLADPAAARGKGNVSVTLKVTGEIQAAGAPKEEGAKEEGKGKEKDKDKDKKSKSDVPISPELLGGGMPTTLFSSHRSAWLDTGAGNGKFRSDHVANFVEISLSNLRFPDEKGKEKDDDEEYPVYRVKVAMHGYSQTSIALHRPKKTWHQVIDNFGDPNVIKFSGSQLFLPLPPGCWGNEDSIVLRRIEIQVLRNEPPKCTPVSFAEFMGADKESKREEKKSKASAVKELPKYFSVVTFDNRMLVDQKKSVSAFLFKDEKDVKEMDVYTNFLFTGTDSEAGGEGLLNFEFCLRDRDFVKTALGQPENRRALCVGDKAMLIVEEPFLYPESAAEFRKRFCVGTFENTKDWQTDDKGHQRGVTLREPALSSEYQESGLGNLIPKEPFKQSFMPSFCNDVIPHKFVLPLSEKQFVDQHLPGYYHKIMDDLVENHKSSQKGRAVLRPVVQYLTHNCRQIPVTLLAMYADGTCDVELASDLMESWHRQPSRKLSMPGTSAKVKEYFVDKSKYKGKEQIQGPRYYFSKNPMVEDVGEYEPWGSIVAGIEQGEWVRVGNRYLQIKPEGASGPVLVAKDPLVGLPPKVFVYSASDLRDADYLLGGKSDPYCEIQIPGKRESKVKTKVKNGTLNPVWDQEFEIKDWTPGDPLEFTVYDQDLGGGSRDFLGKYTLVSGQFHPNGFDGSVLLQSDAGAALKKAASLKIRVMPASRPANLPRALLSKVHTGLLSPVHCSGVNIYDARFSATEDVLGAPPPKNDFDPREETAVARRAAWA